MLKQNLRFVLVIWLAINSANTFAIDQHHNAKNIFTEDRSIITIASNAPQFTIRLKSNPTTGYSWFLREYDSNVITPIKHTFQAPTKHLMGASGYELWTFKLKENAFIVPMQTNLKFIYARPWSPSEGSKQLIFNISTQSMSH